MTARRRLPSFEALRRRGRTAAEREHLARVVARGMFGAQARELPASRFEPDRIDRDVAAAVLAAGYRRPGPLGGAR